MRDIDRYRGCLIGGAVGDALGYAVEFWDEGQIFSRYGEKGITEYAMVDGAARISDDTQMTLFTANGLLIGTTLSLTHGHKEPYLSCIAACYRDWLRTQAAEEFGFEPPEISWLNNLPDNPVRFNDLCLSGELWTYLADLNGQAQMPAVNILSNHPEIKYFVSFSESLLNFHDIRCIISDGINTGELVCAG